MTLQLSLIIETPTNKAETEKILAGYSFMERMGVTMLEGMITPMDKEDTKQVRPPPVRPVPPHVGSSCEIPLNAWLCVFDRFDRSLAEQSRDAFTG